MGLDMYLTAERYLFTFGDSTEDSHAIALLNEIPLLGKGDMKPRSIRYEAMYWRKAHSIHKWFVDNCQGGIDDCRYTDVGIEQLYDLLEVCENVKNKDVLSVFESVDTYDFELMAGKLDQYVKTAENLSKILKTPGIERWDFVYNSSW